MMRRWSFHDPSGTLADYTFATSPNQRDDPEMDEQLDPQQMAYNGTLAVLPQSPQPMDWSFKGIAFTLADVAVFEAWMDNGRTIELTDHHSQTWRVQIKDIETARKGSRGFPEKQEVTVKCLMLGRA